MKPVALLLLAMLAACSGPAPSNQNEASPPASEATPAASPTPAPTAAPTVTPTPTPPPASTPAPTLTPVEPPAPGTPDGLPDDRTPVSEAPFTKTSAQGAAQVVQTYFALIESGKYRQARNLWSDDGRSSGMAPRA